MKSILYHNTSIKSIKWLLCLLFSCFLKLIVHGQAPIEVANLNMPTNLKDVHYVSDVVLFVGKHTFYGASAGTCPASGQQPITSKLKNNYCYLTIQPNEVQLRDRVRFVQSTTSDGSDLGLNKYWFVIKDGSQKHEGFMLMNASSGKILKISTLPTNNGFNSFETYCSEIDYATADFSARNIYFSIQQPATSINQNLLPDGLKCMLTGTVDYPQNSSTMPFPAYFTTNGVIRDDLIVDFSGNMVTVDYKSQLIKYQMATQDCQQLVDCSFMVMSRVSITQLNGLPLTTIPFQNIANTTVSGSTITYTGSNGAPGKAVSGLGTTFKVPTNDFSVTFNTATEGSVGFINYLFGKDDAASLGGLQLKVGIKRLTNGQIVLMHNDRELVTNFVANVPITLGVNYPDSLIAQQNGQTVALLGVPIQYFSDVNMTQNTRLAVSLKSGSVNLQYKPGKVFFSGNNFGTTPFAIVSTDPSMPRNPLKPTDLNQFDWTKNSYTIRVKENNQVSAMTIPSPFNYDLEEFKNISAKYSATGEYLAGEDYESSAGWELIKADMGYNVNGSEKPATQVLEYPYFIMYNRLTNVLRTFVYLKNSSIANKLQINLEATTATGSIGAESRPALWSTNLQFKALKDPTLEIADYAKMQQLNVNSGQFYFADFIMQYDPCISFFESSIRLKVNYITQGDLVLVGRSLASTIPAGTSQYSGILNNSKNFMYGALNTPYGSQSTTLGDVTFNSLSEANTLAYSNTLTGVIEGKKIEEWRKEAARMRMGAGFTIAAGETLDAAGTLSEGIAKVATAADITSISTKAAEGAGKMISAAGKFMKAAGNYTNAAAMKLEYDAIKDKDKESDQNIRLLAPEPRVSMVMGELALNGTVTITSPVFDNVYLTTPGSKNAHQAPEYYLNGSKGARPLYNEPMGGTNLLNRPEFDVVIVKGDQYDRDTIGAFLRTAKRPYVAVNNRVGGKADNLVGIAIYVNTYNAEGVLVTTQYGEMSKLAQFLGDCDISKLIDKKTLMTNYNSLSDKSVTNVQNQLNKWIKIGYGIVSYSPSKLVQQDASIIFGASKNNYEGVANFRFAENNTASGSLASLANTQAMTLFPTSIFVTDPVFGNNYQIRNTDANFETMMNGYCAAFVNRNADASAVDNDTLLEETDPMTWEETDQNGVLVYPNPSNGTFQVKYKSHCTGMVTLRVFTLQGVQVVEAENPISVVETDYRSTIHIPTVSNSSYILNITFPDGSTQFRKLIIE